MSGIPPHRRGERAPLSFGQYRLWFLDQLTPGSSAYNIADVVRIHGDLDISAFQAALDAVVARHEVLRTNFVSNKGVPVPVVAAARQAEFRIEDLTRIPVAQREARLRRLVNQEGARSFDLSRDVMLRAVLFRMAAEEFVFFHNCHHIAWDLRSKFVFYREISAFYRASRAGVSAQLPPLPATYADYAAWQQERLGGTALEELVDYWKQQLEGAALSLALPTDFPRPPVLTYRGGRRVPIVVEPALLDLVDGLSPRQLSLSQAMLWSGISPFHILLAAFKVLLFAYSGQQDILVSSPYSNRENPDVADLIGFFPSTMILRTQVEPELNFEQLSARVLGVVHSAVRHAALPIDKIVQSLRPTRRPGGLPLVQVNFRIQKAPLPVLELDGLTVDPPDWVDIGASKFDLALELVTTTALSGYFEYSSDLFRESTIERMSEYYRKLLRELAGSPLIPIADLPVFREIRQNAAHTGAAFPT